MSPFGVYVSIKSKGSCYGLEQGISKKYWHKWCKIRRTQVALIESGHWFTVQTDC